MPLRFQFSLRRLFAAITYIAVFAWLMSIDLDWPTTLAGSLYFICFDVMRWTVLGAGLGTLFGRPVRFALFTTATALILWAFESGILAWLPFLAIFGAIIFNAIRETIAGR